jgi:hypothetical protein
MPTYYKKIKGFGTIKVRLEMDRGTVVGISGELQLENSRLFQEPTPVDYVSVLCAIGYSKPEIVAATKPMLDAIDSKIVQEGRFRSLIHKTIRGPDAEYLPYWLIGGDHILIDAGSLLYSTVQNMLADYLEKTGAIDKLRERYSKREISETLMRIAMRAARDAGLDMDTFSDELIFRLDEYDLASDFDQRFSGIKLGKEFSTDTMHFIVRHYKHKHLKDIILSIIDDYDVYAIAIEILKGTMRV